MVPGTTTTLSPTEVMKSEDLQKALVGQKSVLAEYQEMEMESAKYEAARQEAIKLAEAGGGWTPVSEARNFMRKNFIGLDMAVEKFGLEPTPDQTKGLEFVQYPEELIWRLRDSHLLIAGAPTLDFIGVRQSFLKTAKTVRGDHFYDQDRFTNRRMASRWYLVPKEIGRNTLFKAKSDQDKLFGASCERLGAVETAYIMAVCHKVLGLKLFKNVGVLTSDSIFTFDRGDQKEVAAYSLVSGRRLSGSLTSRIQDPQKKGGVQKEFGVYIGFQDSGFGVGVGICPLDRPMANIGAYFAVRPTVLIPAPEEEAD
ncbi:MAG: hypothetical protein AAB345_01910 [Patescibacteria group bacterium]